MAKPRELQEAELIDMFCQRYSCPPSVILAEDVSMLRRLNTVASGQCEKCHRPLHRGTDC